MSVSICLTCHASFTAVRAWQKYCQPKCRHNAPSKKLVTREFQRTRKELINKLKLERGCSRCGYNAHPAALDFNHVRGEKVFGVGQDSKVALSKLLAEIDKCDILCANCHRIHTYENKHWHTKRKVAPDA